MSIPSFIVANKGYEQETVFKRSIKKASRLSANRYTRYILTPEAGELIKNTYFVTQSLVTESVLSEWAKTSAFCMVMGSDRYPKGLLGNVVVQRRRDTYSSEPTFKHQEWCAVAYAYRPVDNDETIDLALKDANLMEAADIAAAYVLCAMRMLIDRPTVFKQNRGPVSQMDTLRNMPTTITLSLSQPIVIMTPSPIHGHTDRHMPLHDVRGHERKLRSGKIIWVSPHQRGDANIERRTTYKVVE